MRVRCSLLLAISLLALLAAGCGSSHRATQTTVFHKIVVAGASHGKLSPAVRALIRRLKALQSRPRLAKGLNGFDALVGSDGCYVLVRDHRTHKLTAKPRKHC